MRCSARKACFLLASMVSFGEAGCKKKELEPTPPESVRPVAPTRPAVQFKPVPGVGAEAQEAPLTTQALPQLHSHLEIVTIAVKAGKSVTLPMQYEGVLELRAGSLATVADSNPQVHHRGDMWQVAKGERVTLEASGELAVLRAIFLVPGEK
jgi:hypothetical protein